jgi:3-hydroxybutyryl-CoA dehydrogenase
MGAGIAQVALEAGEEVVLHDVDPDAVERARARIADGLGRRAARLDLDADTIDAWVDGRLDRLRTAVTLDAVAAEAELIIESALEDLELKRTVVRTLDAAAIPDAILATNTSALSVAAIAATTTRPERVLGLHFFNPAPVLTLVEVVVTALTAPAVADRAEAAIRAWGRTTVRCADSPGFIVNRVNRPFTIEALRAREHDEASEEAIDAAVRAAGFPMGPFELMDLVGIDVNLAAATAIWEALGRPDHLRPSPIQARLVDEGRLGRKTGRGFYDYRDGERVPGPVDGDAVPVLERILAGIEREALAMEMAGLATRPDIDLALRLGAGHPTRPAP